MHCTVCGCKVRAAISLLYYATPCQAAAKTPARGGRACTDHEMMDRLQVPPRATCAHNWQSRVRNVAHCSFFRKRRHHLHPPSTPRSTMAVASHPPHHSQRTNCPNQEQTAS
ncbi:hypothetical protein DFH94DRAFT_765912 [Russula ochroleuca]|uniref:Uncharacterized protein n=1 Tax=Russula ochroleuca TaxID=152965 RepID=A0A9P5MR32_9AGAM|nr:hypothetical protein DFH94DRAFT_765912 [Russula ochroleuca]